MDQDDLIYVLVRIRNSGSQSFISILASALPGGRFYPMPSAPPEADRGCGLVEFFRRTRREKKRLWRLFKTLRYAKAWEILDGRLKHDDVVWRHFPYGCAKLPSWKLRHITLIRQPLSRLYSEYRYCKQSYK